MTTAPAAELEMAPDERTVSASILFAFGIASNSRTNGTFKFGNGKFCQAVVLIALMFSEPEATALLGVESMVLSLVDLKPLPHALMMSAVSASATNFVTFSI